MKPDWKDAPEWANWLAQDQDAVWWWYEDKPLISNQDEQWEPKKFGNCEVVYMLSDTWKQTLEGRPSDEKT